MQLKEDPNGSKQSRSRSPQERLKTVEQLDFVTDASSAYSLVPASLRQQLLASYASQYHSMSVYGQPDACAWITALPSLAKPSKALASCSFALSMARLGTTLNAQDMVQESLKMYTQGLHYVQLALWDKTLMYSDDTLAACLLLTMYEVYQCPSDNRSGFSSHHDGCAKLIQMRGPAAHTSGLGHSIFQWFRFIGVSVPQIASLLARSHDCRLLKPSKVGTRSSHFRNGKPCHSEITGRSLSSESSTCSSTLLQF